MLRVYLWFFFKGVACIAFLCKCSKYLFLLSGPTRLSPSWTSFSAFFYLRFLKEFYETALISPLSIRKFAQIKSSTYSGFPPHSHKIILNFKMLPLTFSHNSAKSVYMTLYNFKLVQSIQMKLHTYGCIQI